MACPHCRHVLGTCMALCPLYMICVGNLAKLSALMMRSLQVAAPVRGASPQYMYTNTVQGTFSPHVFSTPLRDQCNTLSTVHECKGTRA